MKTGTIAEDIIKHKLIEACYNAADEQGLITEGTEYNMLSKLRSCVIVKTINGVKVARLSISDTQSGFTWDKTVTLQ